MYTVRFVVICLFWWVRIFLYFLVLFNARLWKQIFRTWRNTLRLGNNGYCLENDIKSKCYRFIYNQLYWISYIAVNPWQFSWPEASFGFRVLSLSTYVCVCFRSPVCQPWACLRDDLSPIQARVTTFGPAMQNTFVKIPNVSGAIYLDLQGQI